MPAARPLMFPLWCRRRGPGRLYRGHGHLDGVVPDPIVILEAIKAGRIDFAMDMIGPLAGEMPEISKPEG